MTNARCSCISDFSVLKCGKMRPDGITDAHVLTMVLGPDKSNELSMLDGDDQSISTDSPQDIWRYRLYN